MMPHLRVHISGFLLKLGSSAEFSRNGFMCSLAVMELGRGRWVLSPRVWRVSPDILESCLANAVSSVGRDLFPTSPTSPEGVPVKR